MKKNYKKIVVVLLSLFLISFGVMGALAAEAAPAAPAETEQGAAPEMQQNQTPPPAAPEAAPMKKRSSERWARLLRFIVNAVILGIVGILLLIIGYYIWEMITVNYSVREQLVDHKNTAVAIVTASFVLGMAIVIGIALTKI